MGDEKATHKNARARMSEIAQKGAGSVTDICHRGSRVYVSTNAGKNKDAGSSIKDVEDCRCSLIR